MGMGGGDPVTVCGTEFNTAVCHLYHQHYFECCVCHVFCHNSAEGLDSGKSFCPIRRTPKRFQKTLLLIVAVVLMSLVAGMIDSVLTAFNAEKTYDIYGGVRLFYALGLILAGVLADIREAEISSPFYRMYDFALLCLYVLSLG